MSDKEVLTAHKKKVVVVNTGGGGFFSLLKKVLLIAVILGLFSSAGMCYWLWTLKQDLPVFDSVDQYEPLLGTMMYSDDGTPIAEFAIEKRMIVPYDKIPRLLILAFVSAEDQNFFYHLGIDPEAISRAFIKNVKVMGFKEGGSTITMQLARTFFLSREKKLIRKIKEVLLAIFELEWNLSKEEILWLYLNQIYLGHGAYGVQQASHIYFGKDVWELDVSQMAILAGLPKAPGRDSPASHPERARKRQRYVLSRMAKEGYISEEERRQALEKPIETVESTNLFLDRAPYFSEHVRKYLYNKYGAKTLYEGGMQVYTTVDLNATELAQQGLTRGLRALDRRQGWRGPLANIPKSQWQSFRDKVKGKFGEFQPIRNVIYPGLVVEVNDRQEWARIVVGDFEAKMHLENIRWARKPDPDVYWEWNPLSRISKALVEGDVVYVRPTDKKGIKGKLDFRSFKGVDRDQIIWDLEQIPKANSALMAKDPESGYVVSMIGGFAFEYSEFNRAVQACRQPGSAFKPVVYTAALEKGWTVSTMILDAPIVTGQHKFRWKPENYGEDFKGEVSVRYALSHSINIPAIKALDHAGIDGVRNLATKLGIRTPVAGDRSVALGSTCLTVEDLVNAYSHFPQGGLKPRTVYIKMIMDRNGEILEDNRTYYDMQLDVAEKLEKLEEEVLSQRERVLDAQTSFLATWLMQEVVRSGTGAAAKVLGRPVGGKTGTTNDYYDAWFCGFTPNLVTGVWIGHDDNSRPLGRYETGGHAALPIWLDFMKPYHEGLPVIDFKVPPGIVWKYVDIKTGREAVKGTLHVIRAPFKYGTGPEEKMKIEGEVDEDEFFKGDDIF